MAVSGLIPCGGLATDPNPLITGPRGGLRVADDVVIERPGVATQRPGWRRDWLRTSPTTVPAVMASCSWLRSGSTQYVVQEWDPDVAGATFALRFRGEAAAITGNAEPLDYAYSFSQFAEARENLYFTTITGARKLGATSDTASAAAGMHEAPSGLPSVVTTGTPAVLPTNNAAAWRWCFRKVDANGLITRSPPSPWSTMTNNSGSTQDMQWIIPLPSYVAANDQIELYRTVVVTPYTAIPSDVMYLAVSYVVTSTDVTNGYATLTDRTPETALGQELYTNPTREGLLKSNGRPPASMALTFWNDCLWFGYVRGPWTTAINIVTVQGATATDGLTGLQRLQRTGDSTNTSNTLTNLASTTSIKIGQLVSAGTPGTTPTGFAAPVTVLSKTATTVTLSANATSSNVGATYYFHDGITIDGVTYWASTGEAFGDYPSFTVTAGNREKSTARSLAYVISRKSSSLYAYAIEDPYYRDRFGQYTQATVVVRSRELNDGQWAVTFIADTTSSPPAIQFKANASGGVLVDRDEFPHGIAYSKPAEPEHVPELNFILVGDQTRRVVAFAPLDSALLVFKEDGIFRITGSPPDGWRVDLIAAGAVILRGEAVDVLDGRAYVRTERGVLAVDAGGAVNVSDGQIGWALKATAVPGQFTFVRAHPRFNLVLVGLPDDTDESNCSVQYAFNTITRAWTRWTFPLYCCVFTGSEGTMYGAKGSSTALTWDVRLFRDRTFGVTYTGSDAQITSALWTSTSGADTATITDADAATMGWEPKAGDWLSCVIGGSTYYRRIDSITDAGASKTLTLNEAWPVGAQSSRTTWEGIVSKLQWNAFTVGTPAVALQAREIHAAFDWSAYTEAQPGGSTARLLLGASTNLVNTAATQEWTLTRATLPTVDVRANVPTNVSRATHLYPYLETDDIGLDWRCDGIAIVYEGTSEKGVR